MRILFDQGTPAPLRDFLSSHRVETAYEKGWSTLRNHPRVSKSMTNPLAQGPLSEEEIEELEQFLLDTPDIEESMDVSMLDGFLTAIVCGPKTVLPSEWLRWVWDLAKGEDAPAFESLEQAQHITGLLIRHMNGIATTLMEAPEEYEPLLMENRSDGDPIPIIDEWCMGFMKGVFLDDAGWAPLLAEKPQCLATVLLYGTRAGWDALEKKKLSLDEHKALAGALAATVRAVHAHFLEQRHVQMAVGGMPGVVRREPVCNPGKVGRNETCPCGSGKKYKHCHGASGSLH